MIRSLIYLLILTLITSCSIRRPVNRDFLADAAPPVTGQAIAEDNTFWQEQPEQIWARLQSLSPRELAEAADNAHGETERAWVDLAVISHQYSMNDAQLMVSLLAWQAQHPTHPGNHLLPDAATLEALAHPSMPKQIALLLPGQGPSAPAGKSIRSGFLTAYYAALKHNSGTTAVRFYDTAAGNPIGDVYDEAVTNGAEQLIGPLTRDEVQTLSSQIKTTPPVLALNYTAGLFSSPAAMVQFGLAPEDEAIQLAAHAKAAGYTHALLIAPDDAWGKRVARVLRDAFGTAGGQVIDSLSYTKREQLSDDIAQLLQVIPQEKNDTLLPEEHRRQDAEVIFLLAPPADARQIVPLLKYHFAGDLPVYSISTIYTGTPNPTADLDLDGVIFCDIPGAASSHPAPSRLSALGHDAFEVAIRMERLKKLPAFPLDGMTGELTLESGQRIFRHLTWMQMKNGRPQLENR